MPEEQISGDQEDREESGNGLRLHATNAEKPIRFHSNRRPVDQFCVAIASVQVERIAKN
jgi:hypothetical protein